MYFYEFLWIFLWIFFWIFWKKLDFLIFSSHLFGILNAAPFGIAVAKVNEFLQLAGPKSADALLVDFDQPEIQVTDVQHNDFVLVPVIIHDMSTNVEHQIR